MTLATRGQPRFLPDPPDLGRALARAVAAKALNVITWDSGQESAEQILQKMWPDDRQAPLVLRAATAPASTTGWGSQFATTTVSAAFVAGLQQTASGALIGRGLQLSLEGIQQISIPRVLTNAALGFVAEGAPIPMLQRSMSASTLGPAKAIRGIAALTNELAEHSSPNAETVIRTVLEESASRALDAAIFSATAASASQPAGILNGVSGQSPTAGGGFTALIADVKNLIGAIADAGGGADIVFFANPRQVVALKLLAGPAFDYPVIGSNVIASGTVICVDAAAFASGFTDVPLIEIGRESTIHMEDTSPLQLATGAQGSAVVASPATSMYQVDSFALRLTLRAAYVMRSPLVSWVAAATW